jgi:NAD(P)-dependent dehydrogenase (short-subunit alcohol dehydrogenase family)
VASTESVSTWDGAQGIVGTAMDAFGRIDAIVNNAGIVRDKFFFNMPIEDWLAVIDVHLHGTFYVSRAAAPLFKEQCSGSFIHITSTSALIGNLGQANYAAAKLGVVGLSRSIALDMAKFSVRSNCIAPFAASRMTDSIATDTPEGRARVESFTSTRSLHSERCSLRWR